MKLWQLFDLWKHAMVHGDATRAAELEQQIQARIHAIGGEA